MFGRARLPSAAHGWPASSPFIKAAHDELVASTELIFRKRLTWLLIFGPVALIGKTGAFGEATCFILAGLTLIPLAERLSFVTEEVACHTNQTIGALLNATFGNAPELLISASALQEGFYRVVQLALLGSMLTNLLFVFGLSCFIGGLRWQVQELRIVSGNASIGMLMLATAGLALPAALLLSDEMISMGEMEKKFLDKNFDGKSDINDGPTESMVGFSRFNAVIMIVGYLLYLLFQLGSHSEEFEDLEEEDEGGSSVEEGSHDEEEGHVPCREVSRRRKRARKNKFCVGLFGLKGCRGEDDEDEHRPMYRRVSREMEMSPRARENHEEGAHIDSGSLSLPDYKRKSSDISSGNLSLPDYLRKHSDAGHEDIPQSRSDIGPLRVVSLDDEEDTVHMSNVSSRRRVSALSEGEDDPGAGGGGSSNGPPPRRLQSGKSHCSDGSTEDEHFITFTDGAGVGDGEAHMSFRAGLLWLFIITLSISAMSDILVDTIDGFAFRYGISEVFTSLVILPYFSNIAEQVSALIFAYRNEMDLCVGITVGSAVQIALFVLPGSVLIGWATDRSMSLFFRGFETCCLIFSVTSVAAVLQGGTTNWLVGAYLLGVYFMVAAGFWFHELENLSIDGELLSLHNHTGL